MARILVVGPDSVAGRTATAHIVERMRHDGHDATACTDPAREVPDCDAVVALVEAPQAALAAGLAASLRKPVLGLAGTDGTPTWLRSALTRTREADTVEGWLDALGDFYADVNPFAGKLVRDLVPQLVKEAGYDVRFRPVNADDRPRFLKKKILEEAEQLMAAQAGEEKEEIADVLEALETLIRVRTYDREQLKQVKEAKRKRRGGFERAYVVEATARPEAEAPLEEPVPGPEQTAPGPEGTGPTPHEADPKPHEAGPEPTQPKADPAPSEPPQSERPLAPPATAAPTGQTPHGEPDDTNRTGGFDDIAFFDLPTFIPDDEDDAPRPQRQTQFYEV